MEMQKKQKTPDIPLLWDVRRKILNVLPPNFRNRPEGKRYGREHAAYLIVVCLTKQVIAIGDIQQLIQVQQGTAFDVAVAYDYFCTELESILAHVFNGAPLRPDSSRTHARETRLVRSAGFAVAHKIYLSQYLRYLNAQAGQA